MVYMVQYVAEDFLKNLRSTVYGPKLYQLTTVVRTYHVFILTSHSILAFWRRLILPKILRNLVKLTLNTTNAFFLITVCDILPFETCTPMI